MFIGYLNELFYELSIHIACQNQSLVIKLLDCIRFECVLRHSLSWEVKSDSSFLEAAWWVGNKNHSVSRTPKILVPTTLPRSLAYGVTLGKRRPRVGGNLPIYKMKGLHVYL